MSVCMHVCTAVRIYRIYRSIPMEQLANSTVFDIVTCGLVDRFTTSRLAVVSEQIYDALGTPRSLTRHSRRRPGNSAGWRIAISRAA